MDPTANLEEQIRIVKRILDGAVNGKTCLAVEEAADAADRLAELVLAMGAWILRGGFLPESQNVARK